MYDPSIHPACSSRKTVGSRMGRLLGGVLLLLMAARVLPAEAEAVLTVEPQSARGLPGEPMTISFRVELPVYRPVRFRFPAAPGLLLRAVETVPVHRSANGAYLVERKAVWQGLNAGTTILTNLVAEIDGESHPFPPVTLTVDEIEPTPPPSAEEGER